ncbi:MAG: XdhC family protein [Bacteroidales bacterium]|jgi:xanthine dehydrogenase accessory factor|nr:XdhC family protein [Bacteroidales bacterium]
MKNIYLQLAQYAQQVTGPVLATVTGTRGSTPQKPGSTALFGNGRLLAGTVGGGFVENKVWEQALKCSANGESSWMHFSLDNDITRKEEAICGGSISILIDASPFKHIEVFKEIGESLSAGIHGVLVTIISLLNEQEVTIVRKWVPAGSPVDTLEAYNGDLPKKLVEILKNPGYSSFRQVELKSERSERASVALLEPIYPLPRLIIAGAGHIGKALSHLGRLLDFEVTVLDDRREYANAENLPDADHIIVRNIGEVMSKLRKDRNTYIVIVTRGHDDDAAALRPCIETGAAYVGMIGSKPKVAKMRQEFIARKWATEEQWQKIYTPVGLDIGSKTVEEIAVSIAAQLVQVRNS